MEKPSARASVGYNGDFYVITTMSWGMLGYAEPSASPYYLDPQADDVLLGKTLREALAKSRRVEVAEFQEIFHSGIIKKIEEERDKWMMETYGYKTRRAMLKKMDSCNVAVFDDKIEIQPLHQKSLDGYTARKDTGPFPSNVPATATDAELGAALREGFKRCTSAIR
ncbi:contact-dependent growth inhibition system immunity protein [Ralstonia nicotianae]|uniref:contact-dependent growth inhibition system immunity protein n=1 Tax=Ralstonia pseudosolanacearum TaxID=1310165 RepID=UPI0009BD54B8|nr:contact-dependent growth inhibition system immunity protein [Ralstonia pseudosolanacearum]QIK20726.1 CdiI family contact-dependent growth inhibition immunity protein [Ralstonia solanacearum]MDO3515837.1 contact-dependent growth inhibition system immunity protein [Ralstonia pseudosolanacearum]MDO3544124.1 contact-dependent growth inhibition system immunity protein [Ralstonia pseudosolanacearum]UZF23238.1 CdiI family contact-dependent growth inhibition immunity protein [Ralstonia solanacearum]